MFGNRFSENSAVFEIMCGRIWWNQTSRNDNMAHAFCMLDD
jgi:hypothetical protein